MTSIIYFDVDGTLIHKPRLYEVIALSLNEAGFAVPWETVRDYHIALSGFMTFPSKTSKTFYDAFNGELLYSLGIAPRRELIDTIYGQCKQIPWKAFEDVQALGEIFLPKGILSNWDETLEQKLKALIPFSFDYIFGSGQAGVAKPGEDFFRSAFARPNVPMDQILYVGDSVKLDIEPAAHLGVRAVLIDRDDRYPWYTGERIRTLREIIQMVQ